MSELTHFDSGGSARMVDVSGKAAAVRTAVAAGRISVSREIMALIKSGGMGKGDVLGVARIAGIMGAKKTSELIPLCHPLFISQCGVDFELEEQPEGCAVRALCTVKTQGQTGVEMEALTGVTTALLTVYDMCKAADKRMCITDVHLVSKSGGKSGDFKWEK